MQLHSCSIHHKDKEVDIKLKYNEVTIPKMKYTITLEASGDLKHHLIEGIMRLLAKLFDDTHAHLIDEMYDPFRKKFRREIWNKL